MSCDAAAALFLFFASASPGQAPAIAPAVTVAAPTSVATEPLFAASTTTARDGALKEMGYLLRDNVEVILAPPSPPA